MNIPVRSNTNKKLESSLMTQVGKAIGDYSMITDQDKILVCVSGGKDSYTMLELLTNLSSYAPIHFEVIAMHLDQGHPGYPTDVMEDYFKGIGVKYHIEKQDTYSVVKRIIPEGKTMCSLCSRLRRGIIYRVAKELGATKIALGHHRNDVIETFFLNIFHGSRIKAMPPKLLSDDKKNIVIRPLYYCEESEIARYAAQREFPIIPCDLCGSQEQLKRKQLKEMIKQWKLEDPYIDQKIFRSLQNIDPSQMADQNLFDFKNIEIADS